MGAKIFAALFTCAIYAIVIIATILLNKYLIRYGINYYFKKKQEYDSQRDIDDIQQDLFRSHDS